MAPVPKFDRCTRSTRPRLESVAKPKMSTPPRLVDMANTVRHRAIEVRSPERLREPYSRFLAISLGKEWTVPSYDSPWCDRARVPYCSFIEPRDIVEFAEQAAHGCWRWRRARLDPLADRRAGPCRSWELAILHSMWPWPFQLQRFYAWNPRMGPCDRGRYCVASIPYKLHITYR